MAPEAAQTQIPDTPFPTSQPADAAASDVASGAANPVASNDALNRVVRGAHQTIDRLAEHAAPHVQRLQETVTSANGALHKRADELRETGDEWTESLRTTVRENPIAAVATALAVGILIARLVR